MKTVEEIKKALSQCFGTTQYFKHWINAFVYTDGVKILAEMADCYWLLDAIGSYRRKEKFQVWKLVVKDGSAVLTMVEDSGQPNKVKQEITYTDFPLPEITLLIKEGGYGTQDNWTPCLVLMLPSED